MPAPLSTSALPLQLVFDLETLLVDSLTGVNHALHLVAQQLQSQRPAPQLCAEELHQRRLRSVLTELTGSEAPQALAEALQHYRQAYEQHGRWQSPLREGARGLLRSCEALGVQLHYLSTEAPETAVRQVLRHGLQQALCTIYTAPREICACQRAQLFENFIASREHPAEAHLLLSDNLPELQRARQLGVPTLALGYGQSTQQQLQAACHLDVAFTPWDVKHHLLAHLSRSQPILFPTPAPGARWH